MSPDVPSISAADSRAADRTPAQIEADIVATRARLASTVDELVDMARPRQVVRRQVARARAQVYDADGRIRTQKLAAAGGAAAAAVGALLLVRRLAGRR